MGPQIAKPLFPSIPALFCAVFSCFFTPSPRRPRARPAAVSTLADPRPALAYYQTFREVDPLSINP